VAIAAVNQGLSIEECDPRSDIAKSYVGLTEAVIENFMPNGSLSADSQDEKSSGLWARLMPARGLSK
jgi:hypothetical protein